MGWIREKLPRAASTNYGDSLTTAQNLYKKHQALEQDLSGREPAIEHIRAEGEKMVKSGHFAAAEIRKRLQELCAALSSLRDQVESRREKLKDSVQSQQYYSEASEAEQWIRDRSPLVASAEMGRDDDTVQSLLRKLDSVEKGIIHKLPDTFNQVSGHVYVVNYRSEIDALAKSAQNMIGGDHFDSAQIAARQGQLEKDYSDLARQSQVRRTQLVDAGRYYDYLRQADDLIGWLKDKETSANSEDYGRDLDDCQKLIDSFELLVRELAAAGERVAAVHRQQEDLLRSSHPFSASIKAKGSDLQQLWSAVNEAATDRQQALLGAKQVHKFDQEADETLNWLQEKEAMQVIAEQEDLSQADLATIKTLLQRHDEFIRGLWAVEKQVEDLCKEAERLESQFPDTRDHLDVRRGEMEEQLKDVLGAANQRQQKLLQAEQLQAYFQEYREYLAWIQQMRTTVTLESLLRDVPGCESLMQRHQEYWTEIKAREPQIEEFTRTGKEMIRQGHLLSAEIQEKVDDLQLCYGNLQEIWRERKSLYDENMDAQVWKRDAAGLEAWLVERENYLGEDWRQADSVSAVEDQIREYDDFLTTLHAQGDKFEALKKLTFLEQSFTTQKQKEAERKKLEEQKREKQKKDEIKTLEKQKILQVRKQERERRKTQEISFFKPAQTGDEYPRVPPVRRLSDPKLHSAEMSLPISNRTPIESVSYAQKPAVPDSEKQQVSPPVTPSKLGPPVPAKPVLIVEPHEDAFMENMAAAPPVYIMGARCDPYPDYNKRKYSFRVKTADGAEYLFSTATEAQLNDWVQKIAFKASLPPSLQLQPLEQGQAAADASGDIPPIVPLTSPPHHTDSMREREPAGAASRNEDNVMHRRMSSKEDSGFLSSPNHAAPASPHAFPLAPPSTPPPPVPKTALPEEYEGSSRSAYAHQNGFCSSDRYISPTQRVIMSRKTAQATTMVSQDGVEHQSGSSLVVFSAKNRFRKVIDSSSDDPGRLNGNGFHSTRFEDEVRINSSAESSRHPQQGTPPKQGTPPGLAHPPPGFIASSAPPPKSAPSLRHASSIDTGDFPPHLTDSSSSSQPSSRSPHSPGSSDGDKQVKKRPSRGFGSLFKSSKKNKDPSH